MNDANADSVIFGVYYTIGKTFWEIPMLSKRGGGFVVVVRGSQVEVSSLVQREISLTGTHRQNIPRVGCCGE
jgi:hypothetical protein